MLDSKRTILVLGLAFVCGACGDDSSSGGGDKKTGGHKDSGAPGGDSEKDASNDDKPVADAGKTASGTDGCGASTIAAGTFKLTYQDVEFGYIVHLPPSYDGSKPTPLVLNWHGYGSNASQEEFFAMMDPIADSEGFILVYPDSPDMSWNAGTCCGASAGKRDDVGFARALVAKIEQDACVDTKRVYTTGMSNGGFMSHRLACEAADIFAASAPVAGKVGVTPCSPSRPIPILHFHGTADSLVSYDMGTLSADNQSVPDTAKAWGERDGCKKGPDESYSQGTVTCQKWSECSAGVDVTLCTATGEGHCWPGQTVCPYGMSTTDINASEEIAKFFKRFALP